MLKEFAKISKSAYSGVFEHKVLHTINIKGIQSYILDFEDYCVLVFRGTDEQKDWIQDAKINFVNTVYGKMHKGFKQSWDLVSREIRNNLPNKPLYITGHSYGGALAFIAGLFIPHVEVVTFGCPKVMHKDYANYLKINHTRVRNCNDIVTQVPLKPYVHIGKLIYLDYYGKQYTKINFLDKVKSHLKAWSKGEKFNPFYDHEIDEYLKKL